MTTPDEDPTAALVRRAEERNRIRMEAFTPLAEVLAKRNALQEQLEALEAEYGRAYVTAQRGGWTEEELRSVGAEEPSRRPRGRPAKKRSSPRKEASPSRTPSSASIGKGSAEKGPSGIEVPGQAQGEGARTQALHS